MNFDIVVALFDIDSDCVQVSLTIGMLGRGYLDLVPFPAANCDRPLTSSIVNLPLPASG